MASATKRAYSYSQLSVFETCPAQYGFKLQKKPVEQSEPLVLGIAAHNAISKYVEHCHREKLKMDGEAVGPIVDGLTLDKGRPLPEPFRHDVREVLTGFAESYVLDLTRPQVEMELAFDEDWTGVSWFSKQPPVRWRAKLDLVERPTAKRVVITDWKTGHYVPTKSELEAGDQLQGYAFAASKRWPSVETFEVRLYYVRQQWEHGPWEFSREEVDDFGATLERRMAAADAEKKFAPVPGAHCQRCDWRRHCPVYRDVLSQAVPEEAVDLASLYFLAEARLKDIKAAVKARIKDGPLPTANGKLLGYVQSKSWGLDNVEAVVGDLIEGGVKEEAVWKKLTLSKTSLGQLLRSAGEEELVGLFLDTYGSATIKNNLKEFDPPEDD